MIFVFGSNLAGVHGAGAALYALKYEGAIYGQGYGRQGNSFAIPTKDELIQTLPLNTINEYVDGFIDYANNNPDEVFKITKIGCGLAGYRDIEIAPMFTGASLNCTFDHDWLPFLGSKYEYWGKG